MSEYIYLAKIMYPYEDNEEMLGAYSTRERAESAIEKSLSKYQKFSGRTDEEIKRIVTWVEEVEVNAELF